MLKKNILSALSGKIKLKNWILVLNSQKLESDWNYYNSKLISQWMS